MARPCPLPILTLLILASETLVRLVSKAAMSSAAARAPSFFTPLACSQPSAPGRSRKNRTLAAVGLGMVVLTLVGDGPAAAQAPVSGTRQTRPLFRIERSKNANIVQYDVQLSPEGRLDPKEPVIAYWIRCAEDGRKQELTALQRTWYYGFKATYDPRSDSALMEMEAKNLRPIRIHEVEGAYRGETIIDGQPAFLDRMFVTSVPSGVMRKVTSIELYGQDTKTGLNRYEKIMP